MQYPKLSVRMIKAFRSPATTALPDTGSLLPEPLQKIIEGPNISTTQACDYLRYNTLYVYH